MAVVAVERIPKGVVFLRSPFPAVVRFGGWSVDGQMRKARFLGPRDDMRAKPVESEPKLSGITHASRVVIPADGRHRGESLNITTLWRRNCSTGR